MDSSDLDIPGFLLRSQPQPALPAPNGSNHSQAEPQCLLTKELFETNDVEACEQPEHITAPEPFGANTHSKAFFEKAIAGSWQKSTEGIFDTGNHLQQAREELDPDVFKALRLPFSRRTAERLRAIAGHPLLATHVSQLPAHWGTLYALAKLDDDVLEAALADGRIHPGLERNEIHSVVQQLPPKPPKGKNPEATDLTPLQLRAQLEKLGFPRFRREALPPDWEPSLRDTALSLASIEKLLETLERKTPSTNKAARKHLRALKAAIGCRVRAAIAEDLRTRLKASELDHQAVADGLKGPPEPASSGKQ